MSKIERISNWGYWDALDGERLRQGELLSVTYANGESYDGAVEIDHRRFEASEQGGSSMCDNDAAFVTFDSPRGPARIYIRGLEAVRLEPHEGT